MGQREGDWRLINYWSEGVLGGKGGWEWWEEMEGGIGGWEESGEREKREGGSEKDRLGWRVQVKRRSGRGEWREGERE